MAARIFCLLLIVGNTKAFIDDVKTALNAAKGYLGKKK